MHIQTVIETTSFWLTTQREPTLGTTELAELLGWSRGKIHHAAKRVLHPPAHLYRFIKAVADRRLADWDTLHAKMQWYEDIPHLMMVGTPPWSPSDYVDVRPDGTLFVPRGRIVTPKIPHEYKEPVHVD